MKSEWIVQRNVWLIWIVAGPQLVGCGSRQRTEYRALEATLSRATPSAEEAQALEPWLDGTQSTRLRREVLVRAVLLRNPNLEAARFAWRAALAAHPQATALDDPTLAYSFAPASIGSSAVRFGQSIRLEQHFPWPGKLKLGGQVALADTEAARDEYETVRLQLALTASLLFDEYAKNLRLLEINAEHQRLTEDIKTSALSQYEVGNAAQQEPLQADLELGHVLHEHVMLESERAIIIAQINALLHRDPNAPLSRPQRDGFDGREVDDVIALRETALANHPELRAAHSRIRSRESALELRRRDYYPDLGVMGEYNSMWARKEHQWMVGASLNVPLQTKPRRGAVAQATAELGRANAEQQSLIDKIMSEVDQARHRLFEAMHVVDLYENRLLPTARAQIDAALVGYQTGRNSFQALIDAERSLRTLEVQREQALTTLAQRRAELEFATGRVPGLVRQGDPQ